MTDGLLLRNYLSDENDQSVNFYPVGDFMMCLPVVDGLADTTRSGNFWDSHVYNTVLYAVNSDSVVLDLGACFGQMTINWSRICKHVHCFEAHPFQFHCITETLAKNNIENVTAYNRAVWDSNDQELIYPRPNLSIFPSVASWGIDPRATELKHPQDVKVKSMTIDSLNLERVDLVKIDTQGSDLRAMRGMVETIRRCRPVIVFEYETAFAEPLFNEPWSEYEKFIDEIGYKIKSSITSFDHIIEPAT